MWHIISILHYWKLEQLTFDGWKNAFLELTHFDIKHLAVLPKNDFILQGGQFTPAGGPIYPGGGQYAPAFRIFILVNNRKTVMPTVSKMYACIAPTHSSYGYKSQPSSF